MDDNNKEQFRKLLHDKFNNNLKELNEALVKHLELIERKQQASTNHANSNQQASSKQAHGNQQLTTKQEKQQAKQSIQNHDKLCLLALNGPRKQHMTHPLSISIPPVYQATKNMG